MGARLAQRALRNKAVVAIAPISPTDPGVASLNAGIHKILQTSMDINPVTWQRRAV